jgi:ABC-type histidine transport system ATPase subunit
VQCVDKLERNQSGIFMIERACVQLAQVDSSGCIRCLEARRRTGTLYRLSLLFFFFLLWWCLAMLGLIRNVSAVTNSEW